MDEAPAEAYSKRKTSRENAERRRTWRAAGLATERYRIRFRIRSTTKWRGRGVASALVDEALTQLAQQQVPHMTARAVRRNTSAMKFFKRSGFQWVRTEEYLLGRDM